MLEYSTISVKTFKLQDLTQDMFKSLIFVHGFTATKDSECWAKILSKNKASKSRLNSTDHCRRVSNMVNLKQEMKKIQEKDFEKIQMC